MEAFELEYSRGRWLAPLQLVDELYDALLRLPAKGQNDYITLGSRDSDVEICCATKQSKFVKEPYAYTEAQAQSKLSAWRDKRDSSRCESCDQGANTESSVGDPTAAKTASKMPATLNYLESPSAATEADAVRCLRERGYIVALPRTSVGSPGSITPPPPYALHLSSSQPVRSVAREPGTPATSANKRKRGDHRIVVQATSCPPTPVRRVDTTTVAQTRDASGEPEIGDSDADDDEVVVSAPQRKKRRSNRAARTSSPQKPTTPPRCTKTKKGTLTSTISYEEAAELTGATVDSPPADAENEADVSDGDEGERPAAEEGDRTIRLDDVHDPPPTSSPEEIGALNLLSLRISAPNTPSAEPPVDDGEDSLFIPEEASTAMQPPAGPTLSVQPDGSILQTPRSDTGSSQDGGVASLTAEERRLYRHFCEDVGAAEGQWDHPSTIKGMVTLWKKDPQLHTTFQKCLTIARRTMGEGVVHKWRDFQEQGWEKRQQYESGTMQPSGAATPTNDLLSAVDPARRYVVAEAYRQFRETIKAKTSGWKSCFRYRRATVGLETQYEAYTKLRNKQSAYQSGASQSDRSMLLHALFREMHPDWRDALPDNFTDKQAKSGGYGQEWKAFNRAMQDGRRWKVFVDDLGFGGLLLIDTSGNVDYLQQQIPIPVFVAWTRLISRVRLDVKEVAARVEGYYDGMEDPTFYAARNLRPLKLERNAYRACSPGEQFEFSGSEGGRTPTADPNSLMRPSETMVGEEYAMEDFIDSSGLEDADMSDLPGSNVQLYT